MKLRAPDLAIWAASSVEEARGQALAGEKSFFRHLSRENRRESVDAPSQQDKVAKMIVCTGMTSPLDVALITKR